VSPATEPPRPVVSVIVPAYRSAATIGECLAALAQQSFRDFEVVVVNSSHEEETERVVRDYYPSAIFEQSPVRLLPHAARNRGVELTSGANLVFTDPDCIAESDWLEALIEAAGAGHGVVCGAMALREPTRFALAVHISKFSSWLPGLPSGPCSIAPTANALYARSVWTAIGSFPGDLFSGDTVQSWKAARAGATPWFAPQAVVSHHHAGTTRSFLRERRVRGEEFARLRATLGGWSRRRAVAYLAGSPLLPVDQLARCTRDCRRAGWGKELARALPLVAAAGTAWSLGEAKAFAELAF
jgi:GT2 family glycosyltransferase